MSNPASKSTSSTSERVQEDVGDQWSLFNADRIKKPINKQSASGTSPCKVSQSNSLSGKCAKVEPPKKQPFFPSPANYDPTEFESRYCSGDLLEYIPPPLPNSIESSTNKMFSRSDKMPRKIVQKSVFKDSPVLISTKEIKDLNNFNKLVDATEMYDPIDEIEEKRNQVAALPSIKFANYLYKCSLGNCPPQQQALSTPFSQQFFLLTRVPLLVDQSDADDEVIGLLVLTDKMHMRMNFLAVSKFNGCLGVRTTLAKLAALDFDVFQDGLVNSIDQMAQPVNTEIQFIVFDHKVFNELSHKKSQFPFSFGHNISNVSSLEIPKVSGTDMTNFDVIEVFGPLI